MYRPHGGVSVDYRPSIAYSGLLGALRYIYYLHLMCRIDLQSSV